MKIVRHEVTMVTVIPEPEEADAGQQSRTYFEARLIRQSLVSFVKYRGVNMYVKIVSPPLKKCEKQLRAWHQRRCTGCGWRTNINGGEWERTCVYWGPLPRVQTALWELSIEHAEEVCSVEVTRAQALALGWPQGLLYDKDGKRVRP